MMTAEPPDEFDDYEYPEPCPQHPNRMWEWDQGWVCPSCVLGLPTEETPF